MEKKTKKVFIGWSAPEVEEFAQGLAQWIESIIPTCGTFVSSRNIAKGSDWLNSLRSALDECSCGVFCVTRENQHSPWMLFEAGSLTERLGKERVCPLLLGMGEHDLSPPLSIFQMTDSASQEDVADLMVDLAAVVGDALVNPEEFVRGQAKLLWESFPPLPSPGDAREPARDESEKTDEILSIMRRIERGATEQGRDDALAQLEKVVELAGAGNVKYTGSKCTITGDYASTCGHGWLRFEAGQDMPKCGACGQVTGWEFRGLGGAAARG